MEYLYYDYKNVKTDLTFSNYEKFVTNNISWKYYTFDLFCSCIDSEKTEKFRSKAKFYRNIMISIHLTPYLIVSLMFLYKIKKGFFITGHYEREFIYCKNLFLFVVFWRFIIQKPLLKYFVDDLIILNNKKFES